METIVFLASVRGLARRAKTDISLIPWAHCRTNWLVSRHTNRARLIIKLSSEHTKWSVQWLRDTRCYWSILLFYILSYKAWWVIVELLTEWETIFDDCVSERLRTSREWECVVRVCEKHESQLWLKYRGGDKIDKRNMWNYCQSLRVKQSESYSVKRKWEGLRERHVRQIEDWSTTEKRWNGMSSELNERWGSEKSELSKYGGT